MPGFFIQPKFNFLYESGDNYSYYNRYHYSVENEKLVRIERQDEQEYFSEGDAKLFIHDVEKNESREISFEDAQTLKLDSNATSPDGFEFVYKSRENGLFPFIFWSEKDYNTRYLKSRNVSIKLNLKLIGSNYNNFSLLGWIK